MSDNNHILISIIMSVYNEPIRFVDEAIWSMLKQTYSYFEFIIILDKPDNNSMMSFLQEYSEKDSRIKLVVNDCNQGLAKSLNRGIEEACGEYIARMDADDISLPTRLENELNFLEDRKYDMVCCLANKIDENGKIGETILPFPESGKFVSEILPIQNIVIHPSVLIKKNTLVSLNGYRPFSSCQDYDLWLRMLTGGYKIGILNETLLYFRRHQESISIKKRYIQLLNEQYIRKLYQERINYGGKDSFTEEGVDSFLKERGGVNPIRVETENNWFAQYRKGLKYIKQKKIVRGMLLVIGSLRAYSVRETIKISLRARKIKRRYANA